MSVSASTTESSHSDASARTTFSDFVQRRVNSEVPIFGGNIRNGAGELTSAISTSLANQLSNASVNIGSMLRRLEHTISSLPKTNRESTAYRIRMMDLDPSQIDLSPAYELDDTRLHYLLDASEIEVGHTRQYFSLLTAARESMRNDATERRINSQAEAKQMCRDWYVSDDEISEVVEPKRHAISKLANNLHIESDELSFLNRAVVHNSAYFGRETNKILSVMGHTALSLLLQQSMIGVIPTSDVQDQIVVKLSRSAISSAALRCSLDRIVVVAPDVDVRASCVMCDTLLAIIGVVFKGGGISAVSLVNSEVFKIV